MKKYIAENKKRFITKKYKNSKIIYKYSSTYNPSKRDERVIKREYITKYSKGVKKNYTKKIYKNGKLKTKLYYKYNKQGKLKSNKYGKAYRIKTKYNNGIKVSVYKQYYSKKGKLK